MKKTNKISPTFKKHLKGGAIQDYTLFYKNHNRANAFLEDLASLEGKSLVNIQDLTVGIYVVIDLRILGDLCADIYHRSIGINDPTHLIALGKSLFLNS